MRPIKNLLISLALIFIFGLIFVVTVAQQPLNHFSGTIDDENPFVEIGFSVNNATTISVDLMATSGDLDPYLFLVDSTGKVIAENDDRKRGDINSSITEFFIPRGEYTIIAARYNVTDGDTTGEYDLNITYDAQTQERLIYDVSVEALTEMGFPEIQPKPKAEWTILVYYGGDSTLEASLMSDFVEFERAGGSTENTRIVALLDRYGLSDANGGWTGARLFEVTKNITGDFGTVPVPTMDSIALADLGITDTGNGETLARFLTWGIMNYPAEHYVLAFGGHGGGWRGVITDDTSQSVITLPQLDEAMNTARMATGVEQFDLLINDACLMGSVEYYDIMARHFAYSLASPEIVIDPALDMSLLTELITTDTLLGEIGSPLVNTYIERDILANDRPDSRYMTFASSDLDEMANLRRAIEAFARVVNQDPLTYAPLLGQARTNVYTYAKFLGGGNDLDIDLGHFMRQVIAYSADAPLISAAQDVLKELEDVRLYGNAADYAELYTSYYSIHFPRRSKDFNTRYFNDTPLKQWAEMLANYYNSTMPRLWSVDDSVLTYHPPTRPEVTITTNYPDVANAQNPPVIGLQVVGRNLSQGQFTVDQLTEDGTKIRLMSTPIVTEVTVGRETEFLNVWKSGLDLSYFNWQPFNLPVVTDGIVSHNELLIKTADLATLAGRYRIPNTENWVEVAVVFNPLGYVQQVMGRSDTLGTVAPITIPRGAEFQTYRYVVLSDGDVKPELGNTYTWGENGIAFIDTEVPAGQYEMGFLVKTFSGINGFTSTPITITASDVGHENFVGYTDLELGINYQYPATWQSVTDNQDILYTVAPNEDTEMLVYSIPMNNDIYALVDVFTQAYDARLFAPATSLSIFDTPALQFDVIWENRPGWRGRGVALYKETAQGGMGLVFIVNATDSDMITTTFADMRDTIRLFDSPPNLTTWRYEKFPNGLAYPIPSTWAFSEDGDWRVYSDPVSSDTFVAIARLKADDQKVLLDELVATYAASATDVQPRDYFAEYRKWDVVGFTHMVNGQQMAGRIYVARIDNRVYAIRIQTPLNEMASGLYRTIFEPLVDGFAPRLTVILSSGGLLPTYTKAALTKAQATCGDMTFNILCSGVGTVTATYEEENTVSKQIDTAQDTPYQSFNGLRVVDVGLLSDNTIDPFSVALFNIQANLPNDAPDGLVMAVFGGITVENRSTDAQMNVFDIFLNGAPNDPNLVGGVLLIAPRYMAVTITINDVEFELAAGSIMFWREASNDIETANVENDRVGVVGLVAKRRPGSWSSEVLKGILRARIYGTFADQVATSVAGTSITFDGELEIGKIDDNNTNLYNTIISAKPDVTIEPPIDDDTLEDIIENQELLNNTPLDGDEEIVLEDLLNEESPTNEPLLNDEPVIMDDVPVIEAPIIEITPDITPVYSLSAPNITCTEATTVSNFATYTTNDGAVLTNATVTANLSASVKTLLPTQVEIEILCPSPDAYSVTVDVMDSMGRSLTTTFSVSSTFAPPSFNGPTTYNCIDGDNVLVTLDYIASDGSTLNSVMAGSGNNEVNVVSATVLTPTQLQVSVDCLLAGSATVDITIYTDSFDYPELSLSVSFTITSSVVFTANPLVCNVGEPTTVTASLVGSDIDFLNSLTFVNPALVTVTGAETVVGGDISVPVMCNSSGSTTYDISVTDLDTNIFNASSTALVNTPPTPPYFSGNTNFTCNQGDVLNVSFEYIEFEGGNTLTAGYASGTGFFTIQSQTLINGNMWIETLISCDLAGTSGTVDISADTTSGIYSTLSVTVNITINP